MSQDPGNEDRFRAGLPIRCHARTAMVLAQKNHSEGQDVPAAEALLWEAPTLSDGARPDPVEDPPPAHLDAPPPQR